MRPHIIFRYTGQVLLLNSIFLLISAGISVLYQDDSFFPLIYTALIAFLFGIFPMIFVPAATNISHKEGLLTVVAGWVLSCLIGMIPYALWGGEFSIINAWFESVSGFTTTGATAINNIEALPAGILFWRASTHWIGGIGVIMFVLSIASSMGMVGMVLYRSEISPVAFTQFKMQARNTVRIISYVYLGLTFLEVVSLLLAGMNLFDAVTHSFATIATGGFSTKNLSIAYYDSPAIEAVISVFMILSGMNFALIFAVILGKFTSLRLSSALKYYLFSNLIAILAVTLVNMSGSYDGFWTSFRFTSFQILSVGTSTGFANADSSIWPPFSQLVIIFFTLQCACAGSTSGGIKTDRFVLMYKSIARKFRQMRYPNAVFSITMNGNKVSNEVAEAAVIYILFYIFIVFLGGLISTLFNVDALSAFSGAAAMMGNVGPGLSTVGSLENYAALPAIVKLIFSGIMLLGRLEIYGLIMFLYPKTWIRV